MDIAKQIQAGVQAMDLPQLTEEQLAKMKAFLSLLAQWSKTFNLTAVPTEDQMVSRHILDSLSVLRYLEGDRILDVGSGAGLPGIPIAIARPDLEVVLLEPQAKRVAFLRQVKHLLGLQRVAVEPSRVEDYSPEQPFSCVVSRAFAPLDILVQKISPLCAPDATLLAMTTDIADDVKAPLFARMATHPVAVPGEEKKRQIVVLKKQ